VRFAFRSFELGGLLLLVWGTSCLDLPVIVLVFLSNRDITLQSNLLHR